MPQYRLDPLVRIREEPEGFTLYRRFQGAYWINSTSKSILDSLCSFDSVDEVVSSIVGRFDVDQARARADVERLIARLIAMKAIEDAGGSKRPNRIVQAGAGSDTS